PRATGFQPIQPSTGQDALDVPKIETSLMRRSCLMIQLDLPHVVANVRAIRERCGVEVWAVVKANAYGLGIKRISAAIAAEVDGFCVFSLDEAIDAQLSQRTGKPVLAMGPCQPDRLADYLHHRVTPA